jgi:hypothetical protein
MLDDKLDEMPDVRLLVIDPIAQLLGDVNTGKDNEVRAALQPLKELAERRNIAVVCVVHLRKAEAERTLYRVSGSIAFVGFARSVLLVAKDDEIGRRSISRIKGNLSKDPEPVEFVIDDEGFGWRGIAPELSADNMLTPAKKARSNDAVVEFLQQELASGPRLAAELYTLGSERGFSEDQLKRAKKPLGVIVRKGAAMNSRWEWLLPSPESPRSSRSSRSSQNGTILSSEECAPPSKESVKCVVAPEGREEREERGSHEERGPIQLSPRGMVCSACGTIGRCFVNGTVRTCEACSAKADAA